MHCTHTLLIYHVAKLLISHQTFINKNCTEHILSVCYAIKEFEYDRRQRAFFKANKVYCEGCVNRMRASDIRENGGKKVFIEI